MSRHSACLKGLVGLSAVKPSSGLGRVTMRSRRSERELRLTDGTSRRSDKKIPTH